MEFVDLFAFLITVVTSGSSSDATIDNVDALRVAPIFSPFFVQIVFQIWLLCIVIPSPTVGISGLDRFLRTEN